MFQRKLSQAYIALSLTLVAELLIGLSTINPAQAQFKPPNLGTPRSTAGGASRSNSCVVGKTSLTALVPSSKMGLTTEERPTFFLYLPKIKAQAAEFILKDADDEDIYRSSIPLSGQQGVVSFKLPADAPPLELNKDYQWYFNVICQPSDRLRDVFATAWVRRVEANPSLLNALKNSKPRQHPNAYAQAGIWQDTLTALTALRQTQPTDLTVKDEWNRLLKSVGLGEVVGEPPIGQLSLTTLNSK